MYDEFNYISPVECGCLFVRNMNLISILSEGWRAESNAINYHERMLFTSIFDDYAELRDLS